MKLSYAILLAFTFMNSGHSQASMVDLNFNYTKASVVIADDHKNSFFMSLSEVLVPEGMGASGVIQPFYVDEIYSTPDMNKSAFLKFGYDVSDKSLLNKVLQTSEGLLFHSHTKEGIPYALMFKGMELAGVNRIINSLKYASFEKTTSRKGSSWKIFNEAIAQDEDCDVDGESFPKRMTSFMTQNPLTRCLVGAVLGVRDNAAGVVVTIKGAYSGIRDFARNPVQSAKSVWESTGGFWKRLQEIKDITLREIDKFSTGFRSLPISKKSEVICRLAYMLSIQYAAAAATFGASLVTLPMTIRESLEEIEQEFTGRRSRVIKAVRRLPPR